MGIDFIAMAGLTVIVAIVYMLISIILREVSHLFLSLSESTFHRSSIVSVIMTALFVVQAIVGKIKYVNLIMVVVMMIVLYCVVKKVYETNKLKAFLITITSVAVFVLVGMILALMLWTFA